MTERAKELKELLKNGELRLWDKINQYFAERGRGLTEEALNLYVYVLDAQGPDKLAGISSQYVYVSEVAQYNLKDYKKILDNVEAFVKKILFLTDVNKYNSGQNKNGLKDWLLYMNVVGNDIFDHNLDATKRHFYSVFKTVMKERNDNTHNDPVNDGDRIEDMIAKALFVELWIVRDYEQQLNQILNNLTAEQYEDVVNLYRDQQIKAYEEYQDSGFKYIQIEYENTQNPENESEDSDFQVVKGTADTLMQSIHFDKTPSVKLVAEAGMGKTKMLEYINYKLCKDMLMEDSRIFPILIICNDTMGDITNYQFKDTVLNKLKTFLVQNHLEHISEKNFHKYLLDNYKVFYLLDGLNEINKSQSMKSIFIKSLLNVIKANVNQNCYFLMTERYSRNATTLKTNVVFYKLSEISDDIKMEFFRAKGSETLFERLRVIQSNYDEEMQKDFNTLLKRPFYLTVFCDLADRLENLDDKRLPKTKQELMTFFVKELVRRENEKGEMAANYTYVRYYLIKLADYLAENESNIPISDVLRGFAEVTAEYGLNPQEYSSDHIIELFEQLGFLKRDDEFIYVDELYADYLSELWLESI